MAGCWISYNIPDIVFLDINISDIDISDINILDINILDINIRDRDLVAKNQRYCSLARPSKEDLHENAY